MRVKILKNTKAEGHKVYAGDVLDMPDPPANELIKLRRAEKTTDAVKRVRRPGETPAIKSGKGTEAGGKAVTDSSTAGTAGGKADGTEVNP